MTNNDQETKQAPPRSAGRIIARNTAFGVAAQLALKVANFAFTVLVVRTLGDAHFGQYSIVLAWAGLFSVIGDLGINQYLGREIARDPKAADQLFWDTVVLRVVLSLTSSVITVVGALVITDYPPEIILGIAIFTGTYFFSALLAPLQSLLVGNERIDIISMLTVMQQVVFMTLATLFLVLGFDFIWLVIAGLLNMPIILGTAYYVVKRNKLGPPRWHINKQLWWSIIKAGLPFAAIQLSLSFAFQVDTIFLSAHTNDATVGWYNVAYRLTLTILAFSHSFNDAILPTLAREHANNPDSVRPWYYTSVRFIMIVSLPIAIGTSLLSDQITLIYGAEFLPAAVALAILVWDLPFVIYHSLCGNLTTSIKKERDAARIYVSIGILNVVLNAILVPQIGLIGACFATVLTDAIGALQFYFLFRHEFGSGLNLRRSLRVMLSGIILAVTVLLLRNYVSVFVVVPAAALVYGVAIWLSGAMSRQERSRIIHLVIARLPIGRARLKESL
jgi:O-antigen/teichoic acid export membrane protein